MFSDSERRDVYSLLRDRLNKEQYAGLDIDFRFWNEFYNSKMDLEERIRFWETEIMRYEYMVHGEYDHESIQSTAKLFVQALQVRDSESGHILKYLYNKLLDNKITQVSEIGHEFARRIKEFTGI